jgi:hypothetical protein
MQKVHARPTYNLRNWNTWSSCTIFHVKNTRFTAVGMEPATLGLAYFSHNHSTHNTLVSIWDIHPPYFLFIWFKNEYLGSLNEFKWKSYQIQSFITFWDLQLWFWSCLHLRSFEIFELDFKCEKLKHRFSMHRWFQMKRLPTTKLHNFLTSSSFILVIFSSEVIWNIRIHYATPIFRDG